MVEKTEFKSCLRLCLEQMQSFWTLSFALQGNWAHSHHESGPMVSTWHGLAWRVWYKIGITQWQSMFVMVWMRNDPYIWLGHLNTGSLVGGAVWRSVGCAALLEEERCCGQESLKPHSASSSFLLCVCGWRRELLPACSSLHASLTWWTAIPCGTIAQINSLFPISCFRLWCFTTAT